MSPSASPIAAVTLSAGEQAHLLKALVLYLATTTDPERVAMLHRLAGEIGGLGDGDPAVLLSSGGAGLRLLYEVLQATGMDPALSVRLHAELAPAGNVLAATALVTVIFDPGGD
jgi:hypothetical protein